MLRVGRNLMVREEQSNKVHIFNEEDSSGTNKMEQEITSLQSKYCNCKFQIKEQGTGNTWIEKEVVTEHCSIKKQGKANS
jgi:hypothetical protein